MDIQGKNILVLGGSGLVGLAVARRLLSHRPASVVLSALTRQEAEAGVNDLREEGSVPEGTSLEAAWGDILLPESLKDRSRKEVLADPAARGLLLDDLFGDLTPDLVERSALGSMVARYQPALVVDCVNTATAFAYQNVFESAFRLRSEAREDRVGVDEVEGHLATLYLPQLIRHVQILLEALKQAGSRLYLRVGTSGTGGMGLNIPFTHSEERPSRMLLAKAGVAGAHTLLLFLVARTADAPAVKEVKPTAAIGWKRIAQGTVLRGGQPIKRFDASRPLSVDEAFGPGADTAYEPAGGELEGVFLDAGENGLFSRGEFEVLTELGLMEFITPEEIADLVEREILGTPTGRDVVAALDATTAGPTYRAGVLRAAALERMVELETEHGMDPVAYEMLGPPRLSKLLFEAAILVRLFRNLDEVADMDPTDTARRAKELVDGDDDLRIRILSIGLPIVLPDGRMLRGPDVRVCPRTEECLNGDVLANNGWIDLRPSNWEMWANRSRAIAAELRTRSQVDDGSRVDVDIAGMDGAFRPGQMVAWIFLNEDKGARVKR